MLELLEKPKKGVPKEIQRCAKLKRCIRNGEYSRGSQLPSGRELTSILGVSYITVSNVLRALEEDGYVKRIHGKGTFVTEPTLIESEHEIIKAGFLIDIKADLFNRFFEAILESSRNQAIYNVPLNSPSNLTDMSLSESEAWLDGVMHNHFDSLVLYGDRHFPFSALKRYIGEIKQLIFVIFNSSSLKFPNANYILIDTEKIGYMAASHFLSNGQQKLVVLSLRQLDEMYRRKLGLSNHDYGSDIIDGIERAYSDFGLDFFHNVRIISDNYDFPEKAINKICQCIDDGYAAFFALGDSRARNIYNVAKELNLVIGEDLSVLGLFDIPLCSMLKPHLSSISVNEAEIGRLTTQAIREQCHGEIIRVEPEIILRDSTIVGKS